MQKKRHCSGRNRVSARKDGLNALLFLYVFCAQKTCIPATAAIMHRVSDVAVVCVLDQSIHLLLFLYIIIIIAADACCSI